MCYTNHGNMCLKRREIIPKTMTDTYCPPKSCIPKSAKTTMKRKRRNKRLTMDFMEFSKDTTKFLKEFQYLQNTSSKFITHIACAGHSMIFNGRTTMSNMGSHHRQMELLLCDFENTEKPQCSKHTDPKRGPWFYCCPNHLENTSHYHL